MPPLTGAGGTAEKWGHSEKISGIRAPTTFNLLLAPLTRSMGGIVKLPVLGFFYFVFFSHGFLCGDCTDRREIWQEVSPVYQAGLLKFWGRYP